MEKGCIFAYGFGIESDGPGRFPVKNKTMYQTQSMATYKKTQVTKMYKKMFGRKSYTKEETIANYEILKNSTPYFHSEIERRIAQLSK